MSIFFPPPPPFVGGAQPNAGHNGNVPAEAVAVNNPPPSHPGRTVAIIVAAALAWQPAPPDAFEGGNQPLTARRLPAALLAVEVDAPPIGGVAAASPAFQAVLTAWQPPPAQPVLAGALSPALQGSLAQPWPGNVALQSILTGWAPATPAPVLGRPLPPALLAVKVDNPPIGGPVWLGPPLQDILTAWQPPAPNPFLGGWQPLQPRVLPPSLIAVAVNQPPGLVAQPNAANWATQSPSIVAPAMAATLPPPAAPSSFVPFVNQMPQAILVAWQPPPPAPVLARNLPAALVTSMSPGAPQGATLWLDFMPGVMPLGLTFTRASANGTYFDATGTMQTAGANVPRFDYDPVSLAPLGLLLENSATNLLLNSGTLATQSVTVAGQSYVLSFYGTGTVVLSGTGSGTLVGSGAYPVRSSLRFTPTAGTLTLTVTGTVTDAQLEIGVAGPSSYIATAGSTATRALDSLLIPSVSAWLNPAAGTLYAECNVAGAPTTGFDNVVGLFGANSNTDLIQLYLSNASVGTATPDSEIILGGSAIGTVSAGALTFGAVCRSAAAYTLTAINFAFNGTLGTPGTVTGGVLPTITGGQIFNQSHFQNSLNGHIRTVGYFPSAISNGLLQQITLYGFGLPLPGRPAVPAGVLAAWLPADPLPTLPRQLPPLTFVAAGQTPYAPLAASVLRAWIAADPLPTLPRQLPPFITAVRVDNPPGLSAALSLSMAWQQLPPPIVTPPHSVAWLAAAAGVPFEAFPAAILLAWQPASPAPSLPRVLPPALLAVKVDPPPRYSGLSPAILPAWQPPPAPILVAQLSAAWLLPPLPPVPVQPPITAAPSRRRTARAPVESREVEVPTPPTRTVTAPSSNRTRKG